VAAETARRVACDASLVTVTENAQGEPLDVGRKTRNIPPAIRRALASRDRGCRFPGCTHQRHVDGHHIQHWVHGGETKLDNLVTLCRFDHRYVHDENVTVQAQPDGHWLFLKPDGTAFDDVGSTKTVDYAWTDLLDANDEQGIYIDIDSDTAATRWRGEHMDCGLAIQGLFATRKDSIILEWMRCFRWACRLRLQEACVALSRHSSKPDPSDRNRNGFGWRPQ